MEETFRKVFIKTEEDLPKDGSLFIWHAKSNGIIDPLQPLFYDKELNPYLLQRFDWYLQPIEQSQELPTLRDELIRFADQWNKENWGNVAVIQAKDIDEYLKSK
jgi:hypothetical protein